MTEHPDDVSALIELLRGYNTPDRTIYEQRHIAAVIHKAANMLERLAAENAELRDANERFDKRYRSLDEKLFAAEAEVARLKEDNALLDSDHNRIGVKCDEAEAELRACLDRWNKANGEANDNFMLLSDKHTLMTERAERAEAEVARLKDNVKHWQDICAEDAKDRDQYRRDAERYRWLREEAYCWGRMKAHPDEQKEHVAIWTKNAVGDAEIDAAIDAARSKP